MRDAEYVTTLHQHLSAYREQTLGVPRGVWGDPAREYGHILPRHHRRLNIIEPLREGFWSIQAARRWTLHRYFHHLSSSQALAFNLLFPLYPEVPPAFAATCRLLGLRGGAPAQLDFEVELPRGDGTNIDVLITEADGRRTVIEVKLTEAAFGRARHDAPHLQKFDAIYRPLFDGRLPESALQPEPFFRDYQLFRNLAQIRSGTEDRVLLLLPRARPQLWRSAAVWCARADLGAFCGKAALVSIEELVAAMRHDASVSGMDPRSIEAVTAKYLLRAS